MFLNVNNVHLKIFHSKTGLAVSDPLLVYPKTNNIVYVLNLPLSQLTRGLPSKAYGVSISWKPCA